MERYSGLVDWKINTVKMFTITKAIFKCNAIPIKIPMAVFTETEQTILQLLWNHKKNTNSQSNLGKEESWRHHRPEFQSHSN